MTLCVDVGRRFRRIYANGSLAAPIRRAAITLEASPPVAWLCVLMWLCMTGSARAEAANPLAAEPSPQQRAQTLIARHANAADRLVGSPFGRPIALTSAVQGGLAQGQAIAELKVPLGFLSAMLVQPQRWCEILLLTPSIASCGSFDGPDDARFEVLVLRRFDQSQDAATRTTFHLQRRVSDPQYLALALRADHGPLGTSDYRLDVEAAPLDDQRCVLLVSYAYRYGMRAASVMSVYLGTRGRGKLGFSTDAQGRPMRGMRGSVERNVMRYFLAMEAHLLQDTRDPAGRFEASLARWLEAIDHYPERIAEPDPARYRRIKLAQFGTAQ